MSIASRITSIEGHIGDVYDTMALGGDTTVNKNIQNINTEIDREYRDFLANGTDTLWNNWLPKANGTGETITLNNTIEAKMDFIYKGNTSQTGTPTPDTPVPVNVVSGDNTIKVEGKNLIDCVIVNDTSSEISPIKTVDVLLKAGTYTVRFIGKVSGEKVSSGLMSGNTYITSLNWYEVSKTFTLTADTTINKVYTGVPANRTFYVQLEKGSSASETYTPYQTPQIYPISLGVENLFITNGITIGSRISSTGGNYNASGYYITPFIKVEPNTIYTKNSPIADAYHRVAFYTSNNISNFISIKDDSNTFTTPSNCKYLRFCGLQSEISITKMTKGNHLQYITTNSIELCKIGANQDYIYKDNGKWYKYSTIGKIESYNGETISTSYISSTGGLDTDATIYYTLTTPTITEITDTTLIYQLEIIKKSYSGQTNISQTNADKPFILDVVALKEVS